MSIFHFLEEIKKELKGNYFLYSEQAFMLQEAYSAFRNILKERGEDLYCTVFDISEKPLLPQIIESLRTPVFFGSRTWTVIKNAQILKIEDFKVLADEIGDLGILLLYNKELPDKIMDIMRGLKFFSVSLRDSEVRLWIEYKAKEMGLELTGELISYIEELTEGNPAIATSELEKIALAGIKKPSLNELKELIYGHSEYSPWDLINALKKKNRALALLMLRALRSSKKDDLLMVVGAMNKFYSVSKDYNKALPVLHEMDILSRTNKELLEILLLRLPGL